MELDDAAADPGAFVTKAGWWKDEAPLLDLYTRKHRVARM